MVGHQAASELRRGPPHPDGVRMEGGDVLVVDGALAVGVTRHPDWTGLRTTRTNAQRWTFFIRSPPGSKV